MIGTSKSAYILIRLAAIGLSSVAPALVGGVVIASGLGVNIHWALKLWAAGECAFFLCYLRMKAKAQKEHPNPPSTTPEQRQALYSEVVKLSFASKDSSEAWLRQWFYGAPLDQIYKQNLIEWLLWAFFQTNFSKTEQAVMRGDTSYELEEAKKYVEEIEEKFHLKFHEGYNPNVKSIRLAEDPVLMQHKPVVWYTIIGLLDLQVHIALRLRQFRHFTAKTPGHRPVFPFSLGQLSQVSESCLTYWYREPATRKPNVDPIVLIHGIGVGLHSCIPMLSKLAKTYPDLPIFCIENLHVSMRIVRAVPTNEEVCDGVRAMLQRNGFDRAVFVGHSLGTVSMAYLLRNPLTRPMISGLIFLEPVTFLLHLPNVAYNFLYRTPKFANEWMMFSFVSREAGIAWSLWRNFFWFEGVLWKHDVDNTKSDGATPADERWRGKTLVVLAGIDQIVPTDAVWAYLTDNTPIHKKTGKKLVANQVWQQVEKRGIQVVRYAELDHGSVIFQKNIRTEVCRKIFEMCTDTYKSSEGWEGE